MTLDSCASSLASALDAIPLAHARKRHLNSVVNADQMVEHVAYRLLETLIPLVLRAGVPPAHFTMIVRSLLVRHVAERARLRNGRINQSQIAAATDLSRSEIRNLLAHATPSFRGQGKSMSKVLRIASAWRTDHRFLESSGRPRVLPFSGRLGSFTTLVREYGRDVPPRAMAAEMERQGLVKTGRGSIALRPLKRSRSLSPHSRLNSLLETIDTLITALTDEDTKPYFPLTRFICIPVEDQIERSAIRNRVEALLQSTYVALVAMQQYRITGESGKRRKARCSIRVALAMSDVEPMRRREEKLPRECRTALPQENQV